MIKSAAIRRLILSLLFLGGFLLSGSAISQAATLENACALLLEKLNANIAAQGEIVALLPESDEVVIEFIDDLVPAYGAELLVFSSAGDVPSPEEVQSEEVQSQKVQTEELSTAHAPLIFQGSVTVSEAAGHLNRAFINPGSEKFSVGDQIFLPSPVQLYITPVKNLTPYPYFGPQVTASMVRMLKTFPGIEIFNLQGSNQKTVNYLRDQCRNQGRYGLVVQPYVMMQGNRSKVQLRLVSLFSGQSLGPLAENFSPPPMLVAPQYNNQYQSSIPPRR